MKNGSNMYNLYQIILASTISQSKAQNAVIHETLQINPNIEMLMGGEYYNGIKVKSIKVKQVEVEKNNYIKNGEGDADITLPIHAYKYIYVYDEDGSIIPTVCGENNRVQITVPSYYEGKIIAKFLVRKIWIAAQIISLLTCLGILVQH